MFNEVLQSMAKLVAGPPQIIQSLKANLGLSADHLEQNGQEVVPGFRDLTQQMSRFLTDVEKGEIDAEAISKSGPAKDLNTKD